MIDGHLDTVIKRPIHQGTELSAYQQVANLLGITPEDIVARTGRSNLDCYRSTDDQPKILAPSSVQEFFRAYPEALDSTWRARICRESGVVERDQVVVPLDELEELAILAVRLRNGGDAFDDEEFWAVLQNILACAGIALPEASARSGHQHDVQDQLPDSERGGWVW